jgi:hypothetical protein
MGANDETVARIGDYEAVTWFWVRPDSLTEDLDRRLVLALLPWLRTDFAFARVVIAVWDVDERQKTLLHEAGLHQVWSQPVWGTRVLHFA